MALEAATKEYTQNDSLEILKCIYRCGPDEILPRGALRPSKTRPVPFPHWYSIVKRRDLNEWFRQLINWKLQDPDGLTEYLSCATLEEGALHKYGREWDKVPYQEYLEAQFNKKILNKTLYYHAGKSHAFRMTALVIDLDVGRADMRKAEWAHMVIRVAAHEKKLPWPGFVVYSGRGLYVMYLLGDEDTGLAPETTRENQTLYDKCWTALKDRIEALEVDMEKKVDKSKRDYSAWFKAPGTIDTKTGNEVIYTTMGIGSISKVPIYSFRELIDFFGYPHAPESELEVTTSGVVIGEQLEIVPALPDPAAADLQKKKRSTKTGKGSETSLARIRDIEKIVPHRPNHEGYRHFIIWHYYKELLAFYRINKTPNPVTLSRNAAEELNSMFKPVPLTVQEFEDALKHDTEKLKRSSTIADHLGVTEEEAKALKLKTIMPPHLFQALKADKQRSDKERKQAYQARRDCIDTAIREGKSNAYIMAHYGEEYVLTKNYLSDRRALLGVDLAGNLIADLKKTGYVQQELFD